MKKETLDKMVEETMNRMDGAERAAPAPFLLTRIKARMANGQTQPSLWERAVFLLTRPTVAFAVLTTILLINFYIITSSINGNNNDNIVQSTVGTSDEYTLNAESSLYDFENTQP
jgi:hypothetical protein